MKSIFEEVRKKINEYIQEIPTSQYLERELNKFLEWLKPEGPVCIHVNCKYNNQADIMRGGSRVLGYDFSVRSKEEDEMKEHIKKELKENNQPLISIEVLLDDNCELEDLWTKEKISKRIKEGY